MIKQLWFNLALYLANRVQHGVIIMTIQYILTIDKLRSTIYDIKHNKFLGNKRQEAHQYSFVFQAANKCCNITTYISQKNISKRKVSFASFKKKV